MYVNLHRMSSYDLVIWWKQRFGTSKLRAFFNISQGEFTELGKVGCLPFLKI
jgi:hypothetical protein